MGIRVSKRLLRVVIILLGLISAFSIVLHNTEEGAMYHIQRTANNVNQWTTKLVTNSGTGEAAAKEAAEEEEELRKEADRAAQLGEHPDELPMDEEAQALLSSSKDQKVPEPVIKNDISNGTVKACFVSLVRNQDLWSIVDTIRNVEDRFNSVYKYPWIFLNDEPFTEEFIRVVSGVVSKDAKFEMIPKEHWSYPDWIDQERAAQTRIDMKDIIYGDNESYRHMCRFESGFFWRHPALEDYDWYWRVEPDTKLHCDVGYDVFKWMQDNDKVYGFTISIKEFESTIPTLWATTREFIDKHPEHIHKDNMMDFISKDKGKTYNLCHFWSNFEVASLKFWRSQAYRDYFDYLDHAGGFFYERWGDAPVHSIAASLFLPRDKIHFFEDIGYYHPPYNNCPLNKNIWESGKCTCDQNNDFTFQGYSCTNQFFEVNKMEKPDGWKKFRD